MSKWVSQIRKILSDSPHNHLYVITQRPRKIDINFRELTQVVVECFKLKKGNDIIIVQKYYDGFDNYFMWHRKPVRTTYFLGNKYFKYYDSYDMVRFTDVESYV